MNILNISTVDGDVEIREDELAFLPNADLQKLGMSREVLYRCFAEGVVLMEGKDPKLVRPVADEKLNGEWIVQLVHYSGL
jgi:hypothetical protein